MGCRRTTLLLLLPLLLGARRGRAWSLGGPPAPRFAVVPASAAREGKGQLDALAEQAEGEGFLDRILGTNCFSTAVAELTSDCRRMEPEAKTRLALRLANCQLAVQGSATFPCAKRQPIRDCTEALSERAHALFVEFLTHADTMCLHIQNQNFERYTENMLNRLAEGAGYAREQLGAVAKATGKLGADTAALALKAEAALGMLREHGELEQESLRLQKKARAESAAYFQTLDAKQSAALELQDAALQKAAALEAAQAATLARLAEAQAAVGGVFELVEGRAAELAAAAGLQADAQRALAAELGGLVEGSRGIRSAVDVVIGYQQRSDSALMRLLGRSYTLEDVGFYAAGALAALATGFSPATAKARLPVLALMGLSLLGERALADRLHPLLEVDDSGALVASMPLPGWLALATSTGPVLQLDVKWVVRRAAVAAAAAVLLYCLLSHRDLEKESFRLLHQMEAEQRRRHDQYMAEVHQQRLELARLLGGAGRPSPAAEGAEKGSSPGRRGLAAGAAGGAAALPQRARQQQQRPAGGSRALVLAGAGARGLPTVPEESEYSDDEEEGSQGSLPASELTAEHAGRKPQPRGAAAAAAAATPAAQERRAGVQARQQQRLASAAAAAQRKRGASDDVEAAAPPAGGKRRAGGARRGSVTEDAGEVEAMAVDRDQHAGAGGKRARRGSSSQAGSAAKRTRRA